MKSIIAAPFIPISFQPASHRAAQGVIYADLLSNYHCDQIEGDTVICTISGGNVDRAVFLHALEQFGE